MEVHMHVGYAKWTALTETVQARKRDSVFHMDASIDSREHRMAFIAHTTVCFVAPFVSPLFVSPEVRGCVGYAAAS